MKMKKISAVTFGLMLTLGSVFTISFAIREGGCVRSFPLNTNIEFKSDIVRNPSTPPK